MNIYKLGTIADKKAALKAQKATQKAEKAARKAREAAKRAQAIESSVEVEADEIALATMELKGNLRKANKKRVKSAVAKSSMQKKVRKAKWKAYQKEMSKKR